MTRSVEPPDASGASISREQVELAVRGDRDACRALVEALQGSVIATIFRFLGNPFLREVEDIAQEVFLKFFRSLHRYDPSRGTKLRTWMFSIVKNHCFDLTKKRRIKTTPMDHDDLVPDRSFQSWAAWGSDPQSALLRTELGRKIGDALEKLAPSHRSVFVLREYRGLPYKAMADELGICEGTVKSRLHRAKLMLRQALAPYVSV